LATSSDSGPTGPGRPALVVHGGAWAIPDDELDAHRHGLAIALGHGRRVLERGGSALDAAETAVVALEAHPAFDAGRGSVLDRDGQPQLDAGVMCGATLRWGAVAGVRALGHPVKAARLLLDDPAGARLLVGEGAERFAAEHGHPHVAPERLIVDRERLRYERLQQDPSYSPSAAISGVPAGPPDAPAGTVGAVALDADGRLAAATSTGGMPYARPGRVGDTPVVGSGFYADAQAALCATGWGEAIATVQLCARTAMRVEAGAVPAEAAAEALARMEAAVRWPGAGRATGGLIVLRSDGTGGWAFTTPRMARGGWAAGSEPWTAVDP
jgi:beta-aspartyl-peptidase (threonine type)